MLNLQNIIIIFLPYLAAQSAIQIDSPSCGATEYQIETSKVPLVIASSAAQSPNIKRINNLGIKECIQSCCDQKDCHFSVKEESICLLVRFIKSLFERKMLNICLFTSRFIVNYLAIVI